MSLSYKPENRERYKFWNQNKQLEIYKAFVPKTHTQSASPY